MRNNGKHKPKMSAYNQHHPNPLFSSGWSQFWLTPTAAHDRCLLYRPLHHHHPLRDSCFPSRRRIGSLWPQPQDTKDSAATFGSTFHLIRSIMHQQQHNQQLRTPLNSIMTNPHSGSSPPLPPSSSPSSSNHSVVSPSILNPKSAFSGDNDDIVSSSRTETAASICPVCGMTLREMELQSHLSFELECLGRATSNFINHNRKSSPDSFSPYGNSPKPVTPGEFSAARNVSLDNHWLSKVTFQNMANRNSHLEKVRINRQQRQFFERGCQISNSSTESGSKRFFGESSSSAKNNHKHSIRNSPPPKKFKLPEDNSEHIKIH